MKRILCVVLFLIVPLCSTAFGYGEWVNWTEKVLRKFPEITIIDEERDPILVGLRNPLSPIGKPMSVESRIFQEIRKYSQREIKWQHTGEIWAVGLLPVETTPKSLTGQYRPVQAGASTGHINLDGTVSVTAGTVGATIMIPDQGPGWLSNNHIFANSNDAQNGDPIVQPGAYDIPGCWPDNGNGGNGCPLTLLKKQLKKKIRGWFPLQEVNCLDYQIGTLYKFIPISWEGSGYSNVGDWALAIPLNQDLIKPETLITNNIASMTHRPVPMEKTWKVGRTSEYTEGVVAGITATVRVNYGSGKYAVMVNQWYVEKPGFVKGGDSGSVIYEAGPNATGIVIWGSDTMGGGGWFYYAREQLGFELWPNE